MNGNPQQPEVDGVDGFLEVYQQCREKVELSGPTYFSGVINSVIKIVS